MKLVGVALLTKHVTKGGQGNAVLVIHLTVKGGLRVIHHVQDGVRFSHKIGHAMWLMKQGGGTPTISVLQSAT